VDAVRSPTGRGAWAGCLEHLFGLNERNPLQDEGGAPGPPRHWERKKQSPGRGTGALGGYILGRGARRLYWRVTRFRGGCGLLWPPSGRVPEPALQPSTSGMHSGSKPQRGNRSASFMPQRAFDRPPSAGRASQTAPKSRSAFSGG